MAAERTVMLVGLKNDLFWGILPSEQSLYFEEYHFNVNEFLEANELLVNNEGFLSSGN